MYVWGWAPGGERKPFWWIKSSLWDVQMRKRRCYVWMRRSTKISPCGWHRNDHFPCVCWDTGGIDGEIVYQRSKNTVFSVCCR
ncbi:hypothetical protein [Escherichia coli]|uniref:hypothetical protein n=1 Tax=Escherichia coli TaxID=562 RepID=UPI003CC91B68